MQLTNETFAGLSELKYLGLSHEEMQQLEPDIFAQLGSLTNLTLAGNTRLLDLHVDTFAGLDSLLNLNLSATGLQKLPYHALKHTPQLQVLDLYNSSLAFVDKDDFSFTPKLQHLSLAHTYLSSIPSGAFDNLGALQYLDLSFNGWICDDRMASLLDWIRSRYNFGAETSTPFFVDNQNMTVCYRPFALMHSRVMELDPSTLTFYDKEADTTTTKFQTTTTATTTTTTTTSTTPPPVLTGNDGKPSDPLDRYETIGGNGGRGDKGKPPSQVAAEEKEVKRSNTAVIVCVVVAAALTVAVVVVVLLILRRKKQQAAVHAAHAPKTALPTTLPSNGAIYEHNQTVTYNKEKGGVQFQTNGNTYDDPS